MNNPKNLTGVVIDSGHGGVDTGAVGNGIIEKNLTLAISQYMYDRLKELGIPVALTRSTDEELTSATRPRRVLEQFGNDSNVIVISNHINAGGAEGAEVIYALRNNDTFANTILNNLSKEGQIIRRSYQRRLPSNPSKDYYYMLRETPNTEAVIIEYGFLDNKKDANKLKSNYKDYAEAVVRAILEYKGIEYTPVIGSDYYTVKQGDTLWTIAKNNGLTVNELKSLNNLTSNTLSIGQTLKLSPGPNAVPDTNIDIGPDVYYEIKFGDTLYSIAKNNNMTVEELKNLNNLTSNTLSIGQQLLIKKGENIIDDTATTYIVKSGDNLYKIANMFNINVNDIKNANNLTSNLISIGQTLIIPSNQIEMEYITYTVKQGDTLYKIALNNNTSVDNIKKLNNISSDILTIGQKLLIP